MENETVYANEIVLAGKSQKTIASQEKEQKTWANSTVFLD